MKRIAVLGDVHGCLEELKELLSILSHESLDAVYHLGDLVDRGPSSPEVVAFCREQAIPGVMGNHEASLLAAKAKHLDPRIPLPPTRVERQKIVEAIQDQRDWDYLQGLPRVHVIDDLNTVLVHGGLWPGLPIWKQPRAVLYARMILPQTPGSTRWDERPGEYTVQETRAAGYVPWQEIYDGPEQVVYGHTVYAEPYEHKKTIGIDTGCVYGGHLTAVILPEKRFVQVKAKRVWYEKS